MEQIMKDLENPELRKMLAELEASDLLEQKAFDKAKAEGRVLVPVMAEVERRPHVQRHNPVLRQAVRNGLRGRR